MGGRIASVAKAVLGLGGRLDASLLLKRSLDAPVALFRSRLDVAVSTAASDRMDEIAGMTPYHHAAALRRRLAAGNLCFIAEIDGRIVAFNWLVFGGESDGFYRIELGPREAYCMDAFTAEPFRGKAIHTELLSRILLRAREDGCRVAYTRVGVLNSASWKTHVRLGWKMAGITFTFRPRGAPPSARRFWPRLHPLEPMYGEAPW
jgi:GNAT superfamily N-acetyltransferase